MPESRLIASSEAASAIDTGHAIAGTSADVVAYELLNEVKLDMPEAELTAMLALGLVPDEALNAADRILRNPPEESSWISHGLLIAGLTAVLNEHRAIDLKKRSLFPDYLEVRSFRI